MLDYNSFTYANSSHPWWRRRIIKAIEAGTGKFKLWRLYQKYHKRSNGDLDEGFWKEALKLLKIDLHFDAEKLKAVPQNEPLVIVANHPYGVLDGLAIGYIASLIRNEYRVLTNSVLCKAEEIENHVLPVDFSPTKEAWQINLESRQKARALLKLNGCLVIFPAGGVSYKNRMKDNQAWDNAWQPFTAALIQGNKANVLPLYFEGQNSNFFQWASLTSDTLRLSLFFREVANRIGSRLDVRIGDVIRYDDIAHITDREKLCHHLWKETYRLGGHREFPLPRPAFRIEMPKPKDKNKTKKN
ncbi:MAG: lysophospholipid acyltransferase family protein [Alphaproteobacteria bacterium]